MNSSERLERILSHLNLSYNAFAKAIGLSRTQQLYDIRDGKIKTISIALALKINKAFPELNLGWMAKGEGEMLAPNENAIFIGEVEEGNSDTKFTEISPGRYRMKVELIDKPARAGYLAGFEDPTYKEDFPMHEVTVKKYHKGKYKAFEVVGDSMEDGTIESVPDGTIVTCRELDRHLWRKRLHTHDYPNWVFVHREQGILVKRIKSQNLETGDIVLSSLNSKYKDIPINLNDVFAIFNVVKRELE
jgi:phage repressor protein C with HTH and peptisase S24 domain